MQFVFNRILLLINFYNIALILATSSLVFHQKLKLIIFCHMICFQNLADVLSFRRNNSLTDPAVTPFFSDPVLIFFNKIRNNQWCFITFYSFRYFNFIFPALFIIIQISNCLSVIIRIFNCKFLRTCSTSSLPATATLPMGALEDNITVPSGNFRKPFFCIFSFSCLRILGIPKNGIFRILHIA